MNQADPGPTPSPEHIDLGQERLRVAMRAVPLVGGPVELRGALDLETTQASEIFTDIVRQRVDFNHYAP